MAKTYEKMLKTAKMKPAELWEMIKIAAAKSAESIVNAEKNSEDKEQ